jgi:TDG/mug DNA glycosylase family protein
VPPLRDVLCPQPDLLLVGINPGLRSWALGHHFAGLGNPFWRLLHAARLTPRLLAPAQDRQLAQLGIALTNLCPRPTRSAAELTPDEMARGRRALLRKIDRLQPRVVVPVGVTVYTALFGARAGGGAGLKPERLAGAPVFVVPNPSGLNASYPGFAHKLLWYRRLRIFLTRKNQPSSGRSRAGTGHMLSAAVRGARGAERRQGR